MRGLRAFTHHAAALPENKLIAYLPRFKAAERLLRGVTALQNEWVIPSQMFQ